MIHLEHLNLVVKNMTETLTFYQAIFPHWKIRGGGKSVWYGHPRNWLHFGDDYNYLSFNDSGEGENRKLKEYQVGLAHFAFVTNDIKGVMSRLKEINCEPAVAYDGDENRASVYFIDPNGYEIEFVQYFTDLPVNRNIYED